MNSARFWCFQTGYLLFVLFGLSLSFSVSSASADDDEDNKRSFCLTILHNNDGESQLLNAGSGLEDFGGADRFVTVVKQQRRGARRNGCATLGPAGAGTSDYHGGTDRDERGLRRGA